MRNTLNGVHDRTRKVVRGVCLVSCTCPVMGHIGLASVEDRIAQALVLVLHVNHPTHTTSQALLRSLQHFTPEPEVLLFGLVPPAAGHSSISLLSHLIHFRVIHIRKALLDHFLHPCLQLIKVFRGVAHVIREDLESGQVGLDALLEFHLLLARVGVVEAEDELAAVVPGVVVVQHGGLGVADVEVAAGLGGEARADPALLRVGQEPLQPRLVLAPAAAGRAAGPARGGVHGAPPLPAGEGGPERGQVLAPAPRVRELPRVHGAGDLREPLEVLARDLGAAANEGPGREVVVELLQAGLRLQAPEGADHRQRRSTARSGNLPRAPQPD
mmetsp:Transcript_124681/g.364155  ORF Transcript_124681/g.364155 Transcript_124681/m.364155 type:complete len:328 (-) Transcript_124681:12-995(-)